MKQTFTIIFLIGLILNARSQNDTIYIKKDSILLLGNYYNRVIDGKKSGFWIEFNTTDLVGINDGGYPYQIEYKFSYKTLINKEVGYDTIKVKKKIDGELVTYTEYVTYLNKVAPEFYDVTGKGEYKKNYRHATWTFYHRNGNVKSEINYQDGLPISDFDILYPSGEVKITVKKIKGSKWNVCKYLSDGQLIECKDYLIENIDFLY